MIDKIFCVLFIVWDNRIRMWNIGIMKRTLEKQNDNIVSTKPNKVFREIEKIRLSLTKEPNNAKLHLRLGDLYVKWHLDTSNSFQYIDEAITEYQIALESYVEHAELFYKIGKAFYYKGDFDKANNYLDLAIGKKKDYSQAYYLKADIFTKKANFSEARRFAKMATKGLFNTSNAHFLLSKLYDKSSFKDFKLSMLSFWEWVLSVVTLPFDKDAVEDVFINMYYFLFYSPLFLRGVCLLGAKSYDKAATLFQNAIEKNPGMASLYCLLADVYIASGHYEDAICELKMAIWLDSLNIQAYRRLCRAYEEQGDYEKAIEIYYKLIAMAPNMPDLYSNLGNIFYIKGEFELAIKHYQTAITINPNKRWTSVIAQTLGFVYQENKQDVDSAISAYQTAYMLTPDDIDIYINMGSAFYDKEDYDNALAIYRKALELAPNNAKIHCNLGFLYWGKGDTEQALQEYELAIANDKNYAIAHNNLGVIYLDDLGRVQRSIELFKNAIQANPNYALAYFNLARATTIIGDKIEAAKLYQISQDINKVTNELDPADIEEKIKELFE